MKYQDWIPKQYRIPLSHRRVKDIRHCSFSYVNDIVIYGSLQLERAFTSLF